MQRTWTRIEKELTRISTDRAESLRPPADNAIIKEASKAMDLEMPSDLVDSLHVHDGQNNETLFEGWRALSTAEIGQQWKAMKHLYDEGVFKEFETDNDGKMNSDWWCPGWIPVFENGFGDLVCVDTSPTKRGRMGQVVLFLHDDAERFVLANSFKTWMQKIARELAKTDADTPAQSVTLTSGDRDLHFRNAKAAQLHAMKGHPIEALEALEQFSILGDSTAQASVIILRACLGEWDAVLQHAPDVLIDTETFFHLNVPFEIAGLVARAGAETAKWSRVAEIAQLTPGRYGNASKWLAESANEQRDAFGNAISMARAKRSQGQNEEAWAKYEEDGVPPTYSQSEERRLQHRFKMAVAYDRREVALELAKSHPNTCEFRDAVDIAHWFDPDQAWELISSRLDSWHPVAYAQVAPPELITNTVTRTWMTPERCRQILESPRVRWWWDFKNK